MGPLVCVNFNMASCFRMIYGIIKAYADIQFSLGNDKYYELFFCAIYNIPKPILNRY